MRRENKFHVSGEILVVNGKILVCHQNICTTIGTADEILIQKISGISDSPDNNALSRRKFVLRFLRVIRENLHNKAKCFIKKLDRPICRYQRHYALKLEHFSQKMVLTIPNDFESC